MTREEAIKVVRNIYQTDSEKEALETLIPELKESDDERIIKKLQEYVKNRNWMLNGPTQAEVLAWLEKQELKFKFKQISDGVIWDSGLRTGIELGKQKEHIPYTDFVIKPHKGDNTNPYDMNASEAQEYAIKRGFGIPLIDGEVYVDERHITQTIGNILRWADEHPKEQKPTAKINGETISTENQTVKVGDDETEVQKAYREGKNAGRKEVFDHPEEYGLQLRRMYDYETGKRNPEWNEEDKEWLSEVYFAIDHSMYSEDERQAMKKYINSLRKNRNTCNVGEFNPKPGDKFWVRCKTDKDENLWFNKGDEIPAHEIHGKGGIEYIVYLNKDGNGSRISYPDKESFLETFEIIEKP